MDQNNKEKACPLSSGCEITFKETVIMDRSCWFLDITALSTPNSVEYRFNLKKDAAIDIDFTDRATKYEYHCRKDKCNSDDVKNEVWPFRLVSPQRSEETFLLLKLRLIN